MFPSWLRRLVRRQVVPPTRTPRRSRPPVRRARPGVEQLEGRLTPTTTNLTLSPGAVVEGNPFTATAQVFDGGGNRVLVGQVTFSAFGKSKSDRLEFTSGVLQEPINPHAIGWATIEAAYSQGGPDLPDSSAVLREDVLGATAATPAPLTAPVSVGQVITLQGQAVPVFGGDPQPSGGTMTFFVDGANVGTAPVGVDGNASLSYVPLFGGTHQFQVQYNGTDNPDPQANFAPSAVSAAASFTASQPFGTLAVTSSANPVAAGQPVTFTATFAPPAGGAAPTGTVTFAIDAATVTAPLNGDTATYTAPGLTVGTHQASAVYNGDRNYVPEASNTLAEQVLPATTTALAVSPTPGAFGQPIALTATVSDSLSQPVRGTVTFEDGTLPLVTVPVSGNQAVYTWNGAAAGAHQVRAVYSGDTTFAGSTSAAVPENVLGASQTMLTVSPSPAAAGQPLTVTVTVGAQATPGNQTGTPQGGVTLFVNSKPLQTATLTDGGAAFAVPAMLPGTYTLRADYSGDTTTFGPSSSGDTPVLVQPALSRTTLAASPAAVGQPLTLTATVSGQLVIGGQPVPPAGSVTFFDGTANLGTIALAGGQVSCTVPGLAAGAHDFRAAYTSSNGPYTGSSSADLLLTVAPVVTPPPTTTPPTASQVTPPIVAGLTDVSAVVVLTPVRHGRKASPLRQSFLLRNISGRAIQGPLYVVLDGLSKKVRLLNASGVARMHLTPGDPYVLVPTDQLAPGRAVPFTLLFAIKRNARVQFASAVLAGSGVV
jgi:hypothetical protein